MFTCIRFTLYNSFKRDFCLENGKNCVIIFSWEYWTIFIRIRILVRTMFSTLMQEIYLEVQLAIYLFDKKKALIYICKR